MNKRQRAVAATVEPGVLPALKLKRNQDLLPIAEAMLAGGVRALEITTTTPGVLEQMSRIKQHLGDDLVLAAGTTLDAATARAAIDAGASVIVSPAVIPEVIETALRYQVACYPGAFTATEVLQALQLGADMVKVFPAALAGPAYMTNLRMVYPEVMLIPSGGINRQTAGAYIKAGASAISGARNFYDPNGDHGSDWVTEQARAYIEIVAEARSTAPELP